MDDYAENFHFNLGGKKQIPYQFKVREFVSFETGEAVASVGVR